MEECRRTGKWAPGGLQKRAAVYTFGVCTVVFLINIFVLVVVWMISRYPAVSIEAVVLKVRAIFWLQVILLALAAVVVSFWVGRGLFSTLGPVYRFTKYFEDLSTGFWDVPCELRTSDKLHELKDAINKAIVPLVQKISDQDALLSHACYELQQMTPEDIEESRLSVLISQITSEMADTAQRLNNTEEDSGEEANSASSGTTAIAVHENDVQETAAS